MLIDLDLNEAEFDAFMTKIDSTLIAQGCKIAARPIAALGEIAKLYKTEVPGSKIQGPDGLFEPPIVTRVNSWYDNRYADLLAMPFQVGQSLIMVNGDPFRLIVPYSFGSFRLVCDKEFKPRPSIVKLEKGVVTPPMESNLFRCIENLTPAIAKGLPEAEMQGMIRYSCEVFNSLQALHVQPLSYKNAIADLKTAVDHTLSFKSEYGLARWSLLQYTEKLMKAYIQKLGGKHSATHDLTKLNSELKSTGREIPAEILGYVQCWPGIRYEKDGSNLESVWVGFQAATAITSILTRDQIQRNAVFMA